MHPCHVEPRFLWFLSQISVSDTATNISLTNSRVVLCRSYPIPLKNRTCVLLALDTAQEGDGLVTDRHNPQRCNIVDCYFWHKIQSKLTFFDICSCIFEKMFKFALGLPISLSIIPRETCSFMEMAR